METITTLWGKRMTVPSFTLTYIDGELIVQQNDFFPVRIDSVDQKKIAELGYALIELSKNIE